MSVSSFTTGKSRALTAGWDFSTKEAPYPEDVIFNSLLYMRFRYYMQLLFRTRILFGYDKVLLLDIDSDSDSDQITLPRAYRDSLTRVRS